MKECEGYTIQDLSLQVSAAQPPSRYFSSQSEGDNAAVSLGICVTPADFTNYFTCLVQIFKFSLISK